MTIQEAMVATQGSRWCCCGKLYLSNRPIEAGAHPPPLPPGYGRASPPSLGTHPPPLPNGPLRRPAPRGPDGIFHTHLPSGGPSRLFFSEPDGTVIYLRGRWTKGGRIGQKGGNWGVGGAEGSLPWRSLPASPEWAGPLAKVYDLLRCGQPPTHPRICAFLFRLCYFVHRCFCGFCGVSY